MIEIDFNYNPVKLVSLAPARSRNRVYRVPYSKGLFYSDCAVYIFVRDKAKATIIESRLKLTQSK